MKLRSSLIAVAILIVTLVAFTAVAQTPNKQRQSVGSPGVPVVAATAHSGGAGLLGVGTASYDNNTPFNRDGTDGGTVGNRVAVTPAVPTHSIATVSFAVAGNFATSMVMTVWDVNAASAMTLARSQVTGIPQTPATTGRFTAMLAAPIVGHSGSFIAGLRNSDYDPCAGNTALGSTCDGVALTQGTSPAPPTTARRAARINFTSASFVPTITQVGTTGADIAGVNAIFRVTGDNLPVELMQFGVE